MCVAGGQIYGSQLLDPAKAEALRLAVSWGDDMGAETIVDAAEQFEAYLRRPKATA